MADALLPVVAVVNGDASGAVALIAASFTRPADTAAYAVGDLVANSTTAGSVAAMPLS